MKASQPHFTHHSPKSLSCSSFSIIFLLSLRIFRESKAPSMHFFDRTLYLQICIWKQTFSLGKDERYRLTVIDVSVLSANPKLACTGERIIQKTPLIWAGGNSTRLFTNPLTASPLAFTASLPKQKHSRTKSRQLRRLGMRWFRTVSFNIWSSLIKLCILQVFFFRHSFWSVILYML